MSTQTIHLAGHDVHEWNEVAALVIEQLRAPMILALAGPLGAGKTTFVQVLARGLGVEQQPKSPTFSLLRAYKLPAERQGLRRLVHIDAYRLDKASDIYALDLEGELAEPGTIVAIEWPEQIGEALRSFGVPILSIQIEPDTDSRGRAVTITSS